MTLRISLLMTAALALQGCDYTPPDNWNASNELKNVISGSIVVQGIEEPGNVTLFVYAADNQGPPFGTGRPLTFSTVPKTAFTASASGQLSAAFAFPYLDDSDPDNDTGAGYVVTALMDQDGNFNPFAVGATGATCGDWIGAHYATIEGGTRGVIYVSGGEVADNITISVDTKIEVQRPAFVQLSASGPITFNREKGRGSGADPAGQAQRYRLRSTAIHTAYSDEFPLDLNGPCAPDPAMDAATCAVSGNCACDPIVSDPCDTSFQVHFVDDDNDGLHDPYPAELQAANGLKDTWPRVYIEYQGVPVSEDDGGTSFSWDNKGEYEWPLGSGDMYDERIIGESYPMAYFLNFGGASSLAPTDDTFAPFQAHEISVTWSPVVRRYHADAVDYQDTVGPYDIIDLRCFRDAGVYPTFATCPASQRDIALDEIPVGAWFMTVISQTGQTWPVPNEIGRESLAFDIGLEEAMVSTNADFQVTGQGTYVLTE